MPARRTPNAERQTPNAWPGNPTSLGPCALARIVLYKERNALLTRLARTTRVSARVQSNEERAKLAKVRKSMSRIKGVLGERRAAYKVSA